MTKSDGYESRLWEILAREGLADLSQFHRPKLVAEIPLFRKRSDLAFLVENSVLAVDSVLLGFALKFLKSVIAYEEHRSTYFAAVTARAIDSDQWIVPSLFVWSGTEPQAKRLRKVLMLDRVTTPFGRRIKRLVPNGASRPRFDVLEDRTTISGTSRVFVSPTHAPYRNFLPLEGLHRPNTTSLHRLPGSPR